MRSKAENPVHLLAGENPPPLLRAYFELNQLKGLYRQGWLRRGLDERRCETVAEHSFSTAVLAMWLAQAHYPALDLYKVLQMALIHDFGEIYAGDIIPADGIETSEKSNLEAQAIRRVLAGLPGGDAWLHLWQEFEAGETPEARFVRQLDRLEMGLQAGIYRLQGTPGMDEFIASARLAISDAPLIALLDELEGITSRLSGFGDHTAT